MFTKRLLSTANCLWSITNSQCSTRSFSFFDNNRCKFIGGITVFCQKTMQKWRKMLPNNQFDAPNSARALHMKPSCYGSTNTAAAKELNHKSFPCSVFHPFKNSSWNPMYTRANFYSSKSFQMGNISTILKNQSALQVKRPTRKKVPKLQDEGKTVQIDNVVAYAVAEEIDLQRLEQHIIKQGLYLIGELPNDVTNALHVRGKYNVDQKPKEVFIFEDGSVVFWRVPETERGAFMKMLSKFSIAPYITSLVLYEREEMDFAYSNGKTCLSGDIIQLKELEKDSLHRLLELYTFSNALAQSVKLAIWEASLGNFVSSIEKVTEDLRHGRKISMSRRQVLMKTGELFSLRHLINLSSDLLDTPDFYWDREVLEPLYLSLCNYLNIARRTRVMNEKLNHCCELTELLSSQLNDAHHTRLEVMIIVLILVEVVFETVHYVERYLDRGTDTAEMETRQS